MAPSQPARAPLPLLPLLLLLVVSGVALSAPAASGDDYSDENRPYEFGFIIEGQQHRHEKKDERGIIMGEFGFITADGVYHVTVYATDENGDFRIISMKNIRLGPPLELMRTAPRTTPPPPPPPPATGADAFSASPRPAGRLTGVSGCSGCLIPTSTPTPTPSAVRGELQPPLIGGPGPLLAPGQSRPPPSSGREGPIAGVAGGAGNLAADGGVSGQSLGQSARGRALETHLPPPAPATAGSPLYGGKTPQLPPPRVTGVVTARAGVAATPAQPGLGPARAATAPSSGGGPRQTTQGGGAAPSSSGGGGPRQQASRGGGAPAPPPSSAASTDSAPPAPPPGAFARTAGAGQGPAAGAAVGGAPGKTAAADGLPPGVSMQDVRDALLYRFNYTLSYHGHHEEGYRNGDKLGGYFADGRDGVGRSVKYLANEFGYQPKITLVDLRPEQTPSSLDAERSAALLGYDFQWYY